MRSYETFVVMYKQHGVTSQNTAIFSKRFLFHQESCLQASLLDLIEIRFESRLEQVTGFTWFFLVSPREVLG